jgi:hypothetical protein
VRCGWLGVGATWVLAGCTRPLGLGSDVIWSTDFESGDLADWSAPPGTGGLYLADAGPSDAAFEISDAQSHSGRFSGHFTSVAGAQPTSRFPPGGGGLYKNAVFPAQAYYSAWYFIPQNYQTLSDWSILKLMVPPAGQASDAAATAAPGGDAAADATLAAQGGDSGPATAPDGGDAADAGDGGPPPDDAAAPAGRNGELLTLLLRYVPPNLTVVLSDPRPAFHEAPLPDPVPAVPIGRWFQIECFFKNVSDAGGGGEIAVWLDGRQIYDSVRPFGYNSAVYFTPCSLADDLTPPSAELFIDDVAVSWSRVSPRGVLRVP